MSPRDLESLKNRAENDDAQAQYTLAAALSQAGRRDEAEQWLQRAAAAGHGDAIYTLATRKLQTLSGAQEAVELLTGVTERSAVAATLLAVLCAKGLGTRQDRPQSMSLVVSAAKRGDVAAIRQLAMLAFQRRDFSALGRTLLERCAQSDLIAAATYVRYAIENPDSASLSIARDALQRLVSAGYPHGQSLVDGLTRLPANAAENSREDVDWRAFEGKPFHQLPEKKNSIREIISERPDVRVYRSAFSPVECEYIIASAAARLAPSTTVDPRTGQSRRDEYRTSLTATLGPVDLDLALVEMTDKIAAYANHPAENGEFLSVLHYAPGQQYLPHYDWLPPGDDFDRGGQRVTTALLYLNEDYQGGDTHFLTPDIAFRGAPGDLLIFHNCLPDGQADKTTRHASLPITAGAKWIGSQWFRANSYEF